MATNPATVQDVANRWRPLSDDEQIVAGSLLDDAWLLLKSRIPTLEARLDASPATADAAAVRMVLAAMVLRVLRNPDGKVQESLEDYSYTVSQMVAAGWLYVSADELSLLSTAAGSVGAFTIRSYGEADTTYADSWWTQAL